jgi:hypothetical protein
MKNKYISLLILTLWCGSLAACSSTAESSQTSANPAVEGSDTEASETPAKDDSSAGDTSSEESPNNSNASDDAATIVEDSPSPDSAKASEPMKEQTILDHDGVTIDAVSWDADLSALQINGKNASEQNYSIMFTDTSINDYMIEPTSFMNLDAGSQSEGSVQFLSKALTDCGIDNVTAIETKILLMDPVTYNTLYTSDLIRIEVSTADTPQNYDESGEVIYDTDGLKLVSRGLSDDPAFGKVWKVYIANNTDKDISLYAPSITLNGIHIDTVFTQNIPAGKKAIGSMTIFQEDLDSNQITDITSMVIDSIQIQDPETHEAVSSIDSLELKSLS